MDKTWFIFPEYRGASRNNRSWLSEESIIRGWAICFLGWRPERSTYPDLRKPSLVLRGKRYSSVQNIFTQKIDCIKIPLGMYRIPHNYFYIFVYNLVSSDWQGPYLRGGIPSQSLHWQGRWKKINRSMPFWKAHVDFQKKKLTSPRLLSRRNEGEFGF